MNKSGPQVQTQTVNNDKTKGGILQRTCACGQHTIGGGVCDQCQEGWMQRFGSGSADASVAPPIVNEVLRSPGHPLDAAFSASFGELLDHDFSHVRLHTDARAAESARSVNALAYTVGSDIVFGSGQYALGVPAGQRLLAHELTHVVQQSGGTAGTSSNLEIGPVDDTWEQQADAMADSLTKGSARTSRRIVPGKSAEIQREPDQQRTGDVTQQPAPKPRAPEVIADTAADQQQWRTRVDAAVRSQYGLKGPGMMSGQVSFVSEAEFGRRFPAAEMEGKLYTIFLTWGRSWTDEPGQILDFNKIPFFDVGETPTSTEQLRNFIKKGIAANSFRGQTRERDVSTGGRFPVFTLTPQQLIAKFIAGFTEVSVPRAKRQIIIQAPSYVDTLVHEACHFYVSDQFRDMARQRKDGEFYLGNARISQILMEGFAEYFSRQVMRANEAVFGPTVGGYDAEVEQVHRIHATLKEAALREAYFGGDARQIRRVSAAVDEYKDAPEDWLVPGFVVDAHLEKSQSQPVKRKARNDAPQTPTSADAPSIVHDVLRSEDMPLDAGARMAGDRLNAALIGTDLDHEFCTLLQTWLAPRFALHAIALTRISAVEVKPDLVFVLQSIRGEFPENWNARFPAVPTIALVNSVPAESILHLLDQGFSDFVVMPFRREDILPRAVRLVQRASSQNTSGILTVKFGLNQIVGKNVSISTLLHKISVVAKCDATVLIYGETGTGKELCARSVHYLSPRANKAFVPVNCGAIPTELFENEFFGHERGAYTNAMTAEFGLIHEAEGGTIFLDEVDSMPPQAQVKLLRFLQEKEYRAVGSRRTRPADVRVIAALNVDLDEALSSRRLRKDLFYRLNVVSFKLPPLRERSDDIPSLAAHFLEKYSTEFNKHSFTLSQEAIAALMAYEWPGNIRELEHVIQRAVALSDGGVIGKSDLCMPQVEAVAADSFNATKAAVIANFERAYILRLLRTYQGNITRAAQAASKHRRAFWQLIRKYHIDVREFKTDLRMN
jgi:two-component system, NtrC family, response regulator GlrR